MSYCVLFPSARHLMHMLIYLDHLSCPWRQVCKCPSSDASPEGQMGFWICECPEVHLAMGEGYCLDSVAMDLHGRKCGTCIRMYTVDIDLIAGTCCNFVEPHSYPFGWFESESRFWIGWFLDVFKPPRCDLQWPKVSGVSTWVQGDPTWQGFRVATGWPLIKIIKVKDGW